MFISFAPPKEMNQRKGVRNRAAGELVKAKCQLQPKRAPATLALMAPSFWLKFAPFPDLPSHVNLEFSVILRELIGFIMASDNFGIKLLF
jgi:hypothetical protein